jgi:hypothetical protein
MTAIEPNILAVIGDLQAEIHNRSQTDKYFTMRPGAYGRLNAARGQAKARFAALNGWRVTDKPFSLRMLVAGSNASRDDDVWSPWGEWEKESPTLFDHYSFFRWKDKPWRPAAIVTQPYDAKIGDFHKGSAAYDVQISAPHADWDRLKAASWYFPGGTAIYCVTRPGITCRWLPGQVEASDPHEAGRAGHG